MQTGSQTPSPECEERLKDGHTGSPASRCNWEYKRWSTVEDAIRLLSGYSMARIFNAVIICEGVTKHIAAF